ncbi:MAG: DUF599 family protein [Tannerellaceae bacterium]|nr:DUF599 family protein [Tannerellaceae bacterium]
MFSNYSLNIIVISAKKSADSVKIGENAQKTHFLKRAFSLHNVGNRVFLLTLCIFGLAFILWILNRILMFANCTRYEKYPLP